MKTYVFETKMTALSSISHNGGQSFGITSKLRREKFVQPDQSVEEIPVLSGNGLRGMLRDRGMLHMCRTLGYGAPDESNQVRGLTLAAYNFLFSGGSLSSDGGKVVDLDKAYRSLRDLIPLVAIFGGGIGNALTPGKLIMGKAIPMCIETSHLLPPAYQSKTSIWDYLQEEMYTRKDDTKDEHKASVIEPGVRLQLAAAQQQKAAKTGTETIEKTGAATQMQYFVETFAAGTPFYWKIQLNDVNDIEFEAFLIALGEFSKRPYVGGKSNIGLGEVAIECKDWFVIDSRMQTLESKAVARPAGSLYLAHLESRGEEIRTSLRSM